MRLSDFLEGAGRPVAYYPSMARMLGDMKEAVFICQMAYWKEKGNDPDGWIYKTSEEIDKETALSYKEQTGVRDGLKEKGLLQERYARTEHKMYFRVNWNAINDLWDEYMTKEHMTKGKMPKKHSTDGDMAPSESVTGSLQNGISLNSNTYSTSNITTDKKVSELKTIWDSIKLYVEPQMSRNAQTFIAAAQLISFENEVLTIAVLDEATRDWMESRMISVIERALPGLNIDATVAFVVGQVA